jgi:hypothetical protein
MKNYGRIITYSLFSIFFLLTSCSPYNRLRCLLENNPNLIDCFSVHKVQIKTIERTDTQIIWNRERDTIVFRDIRLERFRDTLRFFQKERSCTTFITNTEIRPVKYIKEPKETRKKGFFGSLLSLGWIIIVILGLIVSLRLIK